MPPTISLKGLAIEATNRCNLSCKMCVTHGAGLYKGQADTHPAFIEVDFFARLVKEYGRLEKRPNRTVLPQFQGEPLLHPRFLELCEKIEQEGINFGFTTNACLLKKDVTRELLKFRHFSSIAFSVDGLTKDTYENIRVGANYHKTMANIQDFLNAKPPHLATSVSFTEQPLNEAETTDFIRHWVHKVDGVSVNIVSVNGRPIKLRWRPERVPCPDLWSFMIVLTNGKVVPCCRDYLYRMELGNLTHRSLKEIWYGKEYQRLRRIHLEQNWAQVPLCGDCDTWMCQTHHRRIHYLDSFIKVSKGPFFLTAEKTQGRKGRGFLDLDDPLDPDSESKLSKRSYAQGKQHDNRGILELENFLEPDALWNGCKGDTGRQKKFAVLFLAYFSPWDAATILDHCKSFARYSRHEYFYLNPVGRQKPVWLRLDSYDVIIIHYSIYTISDKYLHPSWVSALGETGAFKIMFIQDEYRQVNAFTGRMQEIGIDALFSCVPVSEIPKVYPESTLPGVWKINALTGYVPEYLEVEPDFSATRRIDVGYRGRLLGYHYGELAQEKYLVGTKFLAFAQGSGLTMDISCRESDRLYGKHWIRFLRACRCTLGSESGASVFDFTGEIQENVGFYCSQFPSATFEEVRDLYFQDEENKIRLNQISPRVFEGIASGACQVLIEGRYSRIIQPNRHYIPLKKDWSNIDDVIRKIKDHAYVQQMARTAFDEIIRPGRFSYRSFIRAFDNVLDFMMEHDLEQGATQVKSPPGQGPKAQDSNSHPLQYKLWLGLSLAGKVCRKAGKGGAVLLRRFMYVMAGLGWRYTILRAKTQPFFATSTVKLLCHEVRRRFH